MLLIGIILGLLFSCVGHQASACDDLSGSKKLMAGPPESRYEYRERYTNMEYEYSVMIPRGLTAYDGREEARHNGFMLPLASEGVIFVSGDPNSGEYNTPREAAMRDVEFLRQQGKIIESESITESHLGTRDAVLLVVVYTCPSSTGRHIRSSVIGLSADKEFLYEVELHSSASRNESDRAVLDQLVKSWKTLSRSRRHRQE